MTDVQRVGPVLVGAPPRASLLPPEIALEASAKRQRRGIFSAVVLVVLVVVGGYVGASFLAQQAQARLSEAQDETTALLAEQAKYSEVSTKQSKSDDIEADQIAVTADEIDWKSFLDVLDGTLPDGAVQQSVAVVSATPMAPLTAGESPLDNAHIAEVTLTANTADVPDLVSWITALSTLPGFVDATPTNVAGSDGGYQSTFVVHIGEAALYHRFEPATSAPTDGSTTAPDDSTEDGR